MVALLVLASNEYLAPIVTKKMNYVFKVKVQGKPVYGDTYIEMNEKYTGGNQVVYSKRHFKKSGRVSSENIISIY